MKTYICIVIMRTGVCSLWEFLVFFSKITKSVKERDGNSICRNDHHPHITHIIRLAGRASQTVRSQE